MDQRDQGCGQPSTQCSGWRSRCGIQFAVENSLVASLQRKHDGDVAAVKSLRAIGRPSMASRGSRRPRAPTRCGCPREKAEELTLANYIGLNLDEVVILLETGLL